MRLIEAPALTLSRSILPCAKVSSIHSTQSASGSATSDDRQYIARKSIRAGIADTPNSPTDYDYLTVFDIIQKANLNYDPEFARAEIKDAMEAAGAELTSDGWSFNGRPIRIKFIIRVEDERRTLGDLVSAALKDAGFQVSATYQPFAPAIQTVFTSDPQQFD